MRIHGHVTNSTANGPGNRAVVWTQGCDLGCGNCWNPETHDPKGGFDMPTKDLVNWVLSIPDIEGLTLSGGEPLQQGYSVFCLVHDLKQACPRLSIGMFTGYSQKELEQPADAFTPPAAWTRNNYWSAMKKDLDFAVMGRFNQHMVQINKPLVSSRNQELVLFSDRYKRSDFEKQVIEVIIESDGTRTMTGFPVSKWEYLLDRVD
jgi:anaerobic ribonucleoside-triphosphate reductase activating protein